MSRKSKPELTAGQRIRAWLEANPEKAIDIAFAGVAGLYLDEDLETALEEHMAFPRSSGSDFVDEVGNAVDNAGIKPLIDQLQEELDIKLNGD